MHFFAVRTKELTTGATVTKAIRTQPPSGVSGVPIIEYSGAYPVSRLHLVDNSFPMDLSLYAYSEYNLGDMKSSARPAIAFTLVGSNPTNQTIRTSFMFNLPWGIEQDYDRPSSAVFKRINTPSAQACFTACQSESNCQSWTWTSSNCNLQSDVPLPGYRLGTSSGLKSTWAQSSSGNTLCLENTITSPGPAQGSIAICALSSSSPTFQTAADSYSSIWSSFSANGFFSGVSGKQATPTGAASISFDVLPRRTQSLTLTLSWYYPDRNYLTQTIGNYYTTLWQNAPSAADDLLDTNGAVTRLAQLHQPFFDSSLPDWLSDMYINSLSHIRSAFWTQDGRWRQWEAYDCVNVDSVHNDGERHVPYIMFFPDSTRSKMKSWAKWQQSNGMIQEQLACGCTAGIDPNFDVGCGRVMSDVSSMFIVYVWELYAWANDTQSLKEFYPNAKRAAQWHISVSQEFGIPYRLVSTYDILGLDQYNVTAYNSVFHLLAMKAAEKLATAMGDAAFATICSNAFKTAQISMDKYLWNSTAGYYNAYWGIPPHINPAPSGALQSDSFYAQVLAYSAGLGFILPDEAKARSHLAAERRINESPFGFLLMTGRYPYPGPWTDNAVWMMANPNWATLNIQLATTQQQVQDALDVEKQTIDWWRSELHDLWNVAGITGGLGYGAEGQPYITSHYGYFMSFWHTIFALSGQQANLPEGVMSFRPQLQAPFELPVVLPGVLGTLSMQSGSSFRITLNFGSLQLKQLQLVTLDGQTILCSQVNLKTGTPFTCS